MSKKTETAKAVEGQFKSLTDSAFQQAGAHSTLESVARYALSNIKGFPEEIPGEAKDALYEGYRMKFDALQPPMMYVHIADHYALATPEQMADPKVEKIEIGVKYAYAFTSSEFGKLAQSNKPLHELIKPIREKCATYCSNRLGDLRRAAKSLLNNGKTRQRATKNFFEWIDEFFKDVAPVRMKNALAKKDISPADEARFNQAKIAFLSKWDPKYGTK